MNLSNIHHTKLYELKAQEYAQEVIINKEKQKYFLDGVEWAFRSILLTMNNATHPMADDATNKRLSERACKDIMKAMKELCKNKETK